MSWIAIGNPIVGAPGSTGPSGPPGADSTVAGPSGPSGPSGATGPTGFHPTTDLDALGNLSTDNIPDPAHPENQGSGLYTDPPPTNGYEFSAPVRVFDGAGGATTYHLKFHREQNDTVNGTSTWNVDLRNVDDESIGQNKLYFETGSSTDGSGVPANSLGFGTTEAYDLDVSELTNNAGATTVRVFDANTVPGEPGASGSAGIRGSQIYTAAGAPSVIDPSAWSPEGSDAMPGDWYYDSVVSQWYQLSA